MRKRGMSGMGRLERAHVWGQDGRSWLHPFFEVELLGNLAVNGSFPDKNEVFQNPLKSIIS